MKRFFYHVLYIGTFVTACLLMVHTVNAQSTINGEVSFTGTPSVISHDSFGGYHKIGVSGTGTVTGSAKICVQISQNGASFPSDGTCFASSIAGHPNSKTLSVTAGSSFSTEISVYDIPYGKNTKVRAVSMLAAGSARKVSSPSIMFYSTDNDWTYDSTPFTVKPVIRESSGKIFSTTNDAFRFVSPTLPSVYLKYWKNSESPSTAKKAYLYIYPETSPVTQIKDYNGISNLGRTIGLTTGTGVTYSVDPGVDYAYQFVEEKTGTASMSTVFKTTSAPVGTGSVPAPTGKEVKINNYPGTGNQSDISIDLKYNTSVFTTLKFEMKTASEPSYRSPIQASVHGGSGSYIDQPLVADTLHIGYINFSSISKNVEYQGRFIIDTGKGTLPRATTYSDVIKFKVKDDGTIVNTTAITPPVPPVAGGGSGVTLRQGDAGTQTIVDSNNKMSITYKIDSYNASTKRLILLGTAKALSDIDQISDITGTNNQIAANYDRSGGTLLYSLAIPTGARLSRNDIVNFRHTVENVSDGAHVAVTASGYMNSSSTTGRIPFNFNAIDIVAGTPIIDTIPPVTPSAITVTPGDSSAQIIITPATTGGTATEYEVASTPGNITATSTTSTVNVTGLTNDTSYTFKATAKNNKGASPQKTSSPVIPRQGLTQFTGNGGGNNNNGNGGGNNTNGNGGGQAVSIVKLRNPLKDGLDTIPKIVAAILEGIVLPIAVPIFAIMLIYSGILFVLARGNPEKIKDAKNTLKWTLIGGAVILGAYVIAEAIQSTIGAIVQK